MLDIVGDTDIYKLLQVVAYSSGESAFITDRAGVMKLFGSISCFILVKQSYASLIRRLSWISTRFKDYYRSVLLIDADSDSFKCIMNPELKEIVY